jgi:two-component system sensor histidine kinase YesM
MDIQQFRYGSNIHLNIRCEESLMDLEIPRMLLQPIVENAVFHGIAPQEQGGNIAIHIQLMKTSPSVLLIEIADDGRGMSPDIIEGLLQRAAPEHRSGMFGIGLNHVHETIQLYYGQESGVFIESVPGKGTTIRLELFMREAGME